jgi:diguanylate cyclase (GGDEF)-like protein
MFGHQTGDLVLKKLTSLIKEKIRFNDFFARFGGEEFIIITPETELKNALEIAEKLRFIVESTDFKINKKITCSFGVIYVNRDDTMYSIIQRVDSALYKAKENGRNKVESEQ